jgi:hypothetical protein
MVLFWKKGETNDAPESDPRNDIFKRILKSDGELMTIVGPEDGSCVCGDWVGAVVSVSGESEEWPPLLDAIEDGVFHEGCQHRLEAYSPKNKVEAEFCTGLALVALKERRRRRNHAAQNHAAADVNQNRQHEFSKLYNAAQSADKSGASESALSKCEAALEMLHNQNIFDDDQDRVEHVLEARIRGILQQQASNRQDT